MSKTAGYQPRETKEKVELVIKQRFLVERHEGGQVKSRIVSAKDDKEAYRIAETINWD